MRNRENYQGARHRTLILVYIAWLTLSLAPAMVTPPTERTFQRGQPEMQQSMDNMVPHYAPSSLFLIQKRFSRSLKDGIDLKEAYPKTSDMLVDAEQIIKSLPDSKERRWIESFIEKMREVAEMLDNKAESKYQAKDSDSEKSTPIPDGPSKQPPEPAPSAVTEMNQITSPKEKRNVDQSELQAVTQSPLMEEPEDDDLVRELRELGSLNEVKSHETTTESSKMVNEVKSHETTSESSKMVNEVKSHEITSESSKMVNEVTTASPLASKRSFIFSLKQESEKAKLKAKLIEEIEEFHRLGGVMPREVIDILYADTHKITDTALSRKIKIDEEMKFTEAGMKERQGMIRLADVNNEDREISAANMKNLPPYPAQQFQYMKFNYTFPNRHPNFVQAYPRQYGQYIQNIPPFNKAQFYQRNPQILEKMNPYNQGKYPNSAKFNQPGYIPNALKQNMVRPYNFYNGRLPPSNYHNNFMRRSYNPYPYLYYWNAEKSPQMMPPQVPKQAKIDTQLSDEMKRELRDGKIIVLSDSVVRSNFEADKNGTITQSSTGKPELEQMDKKIETTTEN